MRSLHQHIYLRYTELLLRALSSDLASDPLATVHVPDCQTAIAHRHTTHPSTPARARRRRAELTASRAGLTE
eukprot:3115527-Prymnesium_polylepis.1